MSTSLPRLTIRIAEKQDVNEMSQVYIESLEQICGCSKDNLDRIKCASKIYKSMMKGHHYLIAHIDSAPVGYIGYCANPHGTSLNIEEFYTTPTLPYKIGSTLFKHMCRDNPLAEHVGVYSSPEGKGGYHAIGFEGEGFNLSMSADRIQIWRDCEKGIFPRFTNIKREQSLKRMLTYQ